MPLLRYFVSMRDHATYPLTFWTYLYHEWQRMNSLAYFLFNRVTRRDRLFHAGSFQPSGPCFFSSPWMNASARNADSLWICGVTWHHTPSPLLPPSLHATWPRRSLPMSESAWVIRANFTHVTTWPGYITCPCSVQVTRGAVLIDSIVRRVPFGLFNLFYLCHA